MRITKWVLYLTILGIFLVFTKTAKAPGYITISLSYKSKTDDYHESVPSLKSVIRQQQSTSNNVILYEAKDNFKEKVSDIFELRINFFTENIKQPITFRGTFMLGSSVQKEFRDQFIFDRKHLKMYNGKMTLSKTIYTSTLNDELDAIITAQCRTNFYPANACDKLCVITKNAKECDKDGNKICEQGYKLNNETMNCDNDWCWPPPRCYNSATCVSMENRFICRCTLSYTGTLCNEVYDACATFRCPNETVCRVESERILCEPIVKQQPTAAVAETKSVAENKGEALSISFKTMLVISSAIVLVFIALVVTVWACRRPKKAEYKSSDENMTKPITYFNYLDNKLNPHSVPMSTNEHLHCSCKCNIRHPESFYGPMDNYYSLRMPNPRMQCRSQRPSSDHLRGHDRVSRASSIQTTLSNYGADCESLPLPPPIESEDTFSL